MRRCPSVPTSLSSLLILSQVTFSTSHWDREVVDLYDETMSFGTAIGQHRYRSRLCMSNMSRRNN